MEGWAGFGISLWLPLSTSALLKEHRNDTRPSRALSILNKCFVSAPSLLFITNKYLSTESLAPRCFTVIYYFCHLVVLLLSPPLSAYLPFVTGCSDVLQLSSVLGGSWWLVPMCQASLLGVPYFLPSPEALPQQDSKARGFIVLCACPKMMPFLCFQHFSPPHFFSSFYTKTQQAHTQTAPSSNDVCSKSTPASRHGGKSPLLSVLYGGILEGDPILFPLPQCLVGWLALVQRGVRWRGG